MIDADGAQLERVLRQTRIPVLIRRGTGHSLRAQVPFAADNRTWLAQSGSRRPAWIAPDKQWELPQAWFTDLSNRLLKRYGKLYVIQPYNEQEKCAPNCWDAQGDICECSCMGARHGERHSGRGWKVVSDTFATRWRGSRLACRLLTAA